MNILFSIFKARRLVFSTAVLLVLVGAIAFSTMPRQEDPFFPFRGGTILTKFPAADTEQIRNLVVKHLERELAEIADIEFVRTTVRNGVAITTVVQDDKIYETDKKWDEVRRAIERAYPKFPEGVSKPVLDDKTLATSTGTYAIVGTDDLQVLADAAEKLRDGMMQLGDLIRIDIFGDPGEQITIAIENETITEFSISPENLASQLAGRLKLLGAGTLLAGSTQLTLKAETDFHSVQELRETPIQLPSGDYVPLASVAQVWLGQKEPETARTWYDGKPAVLVDIAANAHSLHAITYGKKMRDMVEKIAPEIAPLEIKEMFFQPDQVETRLDDLSKSLMYAVLIILGVLMFAMGPRLAVLVAVILPAVTSITLAAYAMGGGILHQMAVIGLVIALGILVDNAIVMIEEVQWQLNHGLKPLKAAVAAVKQLAKPLAAATGTTLAAFVPLVLAKGGVGDFTRSVPTMIMIAMTVSYLFALTVTPMMGQRFLRPKLDDTGEAKVGAPERIGSSIGKFSGKHPYIVLAVAIFIVASALAYASKNLESEFFPQADRNIVLVDIALSEGTAQKETKRVARILEQKIRSLNDTKMIHGFIGNSGPRFYYNLLRLAEQPNQARLVVETSGLEGNRAIIAYVREYAAKHLPQAEVIAKVLAQGPPVDAPIEIRVYNPDSARLAEATELITNLIQNTNGTVNVKHNLGLGAPQLKFTINDARASEFGLSREDIARALLGRSQGIQLGTYRANDDPVPIVVRSLSGENFNPAELDSVLVFNDAGEGIPLSAVAQSTLSWESGAIFTRDQQRFSSVSGELDFGVVFSEAIGKLKPKLQNMELPPGTKYEYGGEAEASGDANSAIATTAPLGVILLLMFLLWQFNSFRRVGIVLVTIPLAFAGVFPGLAALGIPFGFQPLLGSIALIGIVVNNAIVLIDVLDKNLDSGSPLLKAVATAVERRTRPIMLTTATTIAGLLPLAFSNTTMWPPLAWPIIFGLLASTALTLFVVPALCRILLRNEIRAERELFKEASL